MSRQGGVADGGASRRPRGQSPDDERGFLVVVDARMTNGDLVDDTAIVDAGRTQDPKVTE